MKGNGSKLKEGDNSGGITGKAKLKLLSPPVTSISDNPPHRHYFPAVATSSTFISKMAPPVTSLLWSAIGDCGIADPSSSLVVSKLSMTFSLPVFFPSRFLFYLTDKFFFSIYINELSSFNWMWLNVNHWSHAHRIITPPSTLVFYYLFCPCFFFTISVLIFKFRGRMFIIWI